MQPHLMVSEQIEKWLPLQQTAFSTWPFENDILLWKKKDYPIQGFTYHSACLVPSLVDLLVCLGIHTSWSLCDTIKCRPFLPSTLQQTTHADNGSASGIDWVAMLFPWMPSHTLKPLNKISSEGWQVYFEHLLLLEQNKTQCSLRQSFQSLPGADNAFQSVLLGQDADAMRLPLNPPVEGLISLGAWLWGCRHFHVRTFSLE